MMSWERGLFWLWLAGAVGWSFSIGCYIYQGTGGFTLTPHPNETMSYMILLSLPPMFTFAVYLGVAWLGRRLWA